MEFGATTDSSHHTDLLASAAAFAAHLPPRRFLLALGTLVLATGAFAAGLWWQIGGRTAALYLSDGGQLVAALVATLACLRAGIRHQERRRTFWWLLAGSCGAWTTGQVIWTAYDLAGSDGPPIPSWADVAYLSFIPLAVAALLSHPGIRGSGARRARNLLDGVAIAIALLFVSWTSVLGPIWRASDLTTLGGVVALAYPCGDVVIAFFVILAVRGMTAADRLELWCLLGGLAALAFSDSAYAYVVTVQRYTSGDLLDVGWFVGFLAMALGADAADVCGLPARTARARSASPSLASLLAPLLPVLVALGVATVSLQRGHRPDGAAVIMTSILVLLALTRQTLLVFDFVAAGRSGQHGTVLSQLVHAALGSALHVDTATEPSPAPPPDGRAP